MIDTTREDKVSGGYNDNEEKEHNQKTQRKNGVQWKTS